MGWDGRVKQSSDFGDCEPPLAGRSRSRNPKGTYCAHGAKERRDDEAEEAEKWPELCETQKGNKTKQPHSPALLPPPPLSRCSPAVAEVASDLEQSIRAAGRRSLKESRGPGRGGGE